MTSPAISHETSASGEGEALTALHAAMLLARNVDERLRAEVERGALESWQAAGAEAAVVGAAAALREGDWLFPGPRDFAADLVRGVSLDSFIAHVFSTDGDATKGRAHALRLPAHEGVRGPIAPYGFHNGAHLTHAAGVAWASKIEKKAGLVAVALFDEDLVASSELPNALNFAGTQRAPVVFVSVRPMRHPLGESAARRGVAYGIPGVTCDGGDVLAVLAAVKEAIARARRGEGATIVEATGVAKAGESGDPIERFERLLTKRGIAFGAAKEHIARELDAALASKSARAHAPATMVEDVYREMPWHLAEARAMLIAQGN